MTDIYNYRPGDVGAGGEDDYDAWDEEEDLLFLADLRRFKQRFSDAIWIGTVVIVAVGLAILLVSLAVRMSPSVPSSGAAAVEPSLAEIGR